jgi:hypothetical protein
MFRPLSLCHHQVYVFITIRGNQNTFVYLVGIIRGVEMSPFDDVICMYYVKLYEYMYHHNSYSVINM